MFAQRLTTTRELRGITQGDLANRVGISENQIWRYENADVQPKAEVIARLARELDVSTDYLLGLNEFPSQYIEGPLSPAEYEAIAAWRRGDKYEAIKAIVGG